MKHDLTIGREERCAFGDGVFEDGGYLVTFTTDMVRDCSECLSATPYLENAREHL